MPKKSTRKGKRKLQIPTDYKELKDIKATILTLLATIFFVGAGFVVLFSMENFIGAYFLAVGAIGYSLALVYELKKGAEQTLKKSKKNKKSKIIHTLSEITFTISLAFILLSLVFALFSLNLVVNRSSQELKIAAVISIPILILPLLFWDFIFDRFRDNLKLFRWFFIILAIPLLVGGAHAINISSINTTINALQDTQGLLNTTNTLIGYGLNLTSFIANQKDAIADALGLSQTQSTIAFVLAILLALLLAAKFIETIAKWLILLLVGAFILMLI